MISLTCSSLYVFEPAFLCSPSQGQYSHQSPISMTIPYLVQPSERECTPHTQANHLLPGGKGRAAWCKDDLAWPTKGPWVKQAPKNRIKMFTVRNRNVKRVNISWFPGCQDSCSPLVLPGGIKMGQRVHSLQDGSTYFKEKLQLGLFPLGKRASL